MKGIHCSIIPVWKSSILRFQSEINFHEILYNLQPTRRYWFEKYCILHLKHIFWAAGDEWGVVTADKARDSDTQGILSIPILLSIWNRGLILIICDWEYGKSEAKSSDIIRKKKEKRFSRQMFSVSAIKTPLPKHSIHFFDSAELGRNIFETRGYRRRTFSLEERKFWEWFACRTLQNICKQ